MVCHGQMSPSDRIDSIVCGYGKANRDAALMVMFKAYFDDSCSDQDQKTLVLAGCVQRYNVWADFSLSWEAALINSPGIRYLHMREARSLTGEFHGWKAEERDRKIYHLARIIEAFQPWAITVSVSRKEHDAVLKPNTPYMVRHAYFTLFYTVILKLAHWHLGMGMTSPVEYVFDEQGEIGEDAALWHRHIKSWQTPELAAQIGGTPKFEDDKKVLPLQAADMLAWHVRRRKERPDEKRSKWPTAPLETLLYGETQITQDWLIKIAESTRQVPNFELVVGKQTRKQKNEIRDLIRVMPTKTQLKKK